MHDVPTQLESMGVEVASGLVKAEEVSDRDVLKNFELLPKLFSGRQITIEFQLQKVRAAFTEGCTALYLEHGATVTSSATLSSGQSSSVYGEREIALALLKLLENSTVKARANTAFGICTQALWTDDGPIPETRAETGLIITGILDTEHRRPELVNAHQAHEGYAMSLKHLSLYIGFLQRSDIVFSML
jgi:hypothetical protein